MTLIEILQPKDDSDPSTQAAPCATQPRPFASENSSLTGPQQGQLWPGEEAGSPGLHDVEQQVHVHD
jgi:hypothetical protein